ncbi:hypothetical protein CsSME_00051902 [Camellia sinensis var. sinensis]
MTAFRAVACRAAEIEETYDLAFSQVAALDANVESKISALFVTENELSCNDQPQSLEVASQDNNHVVQIPTGLKKKAPSSKGKRRIKGPCEVALEASFKRKSRAKSLSSSQFVAVLTGTPSPLSVGGDVYNDKNIPLSVPPPSIYPTYNANNLPYCGEPSFMTLLQGGYDIAFQDSQGSNTDSRATNTLMCSQGIDGHKEMEGGRHFKF